MLLDAYAFNCLFMFNLHYLCFLFLCVANCQKGGQMATILKVIICSVMLSRSFF